MKLKDAGGQQQEYKQMLALDRSTSGGKVAYFICINLTFKNSFAHKQNLRASFIPKKSLFC
jgi:hypothetical protein